MNAVDEVRTAYDDILAVSVVGWLEEALARLPKATTDGASVAVDWGGERLGRLYFVAAGPPYPNAQGTPLPGLYYHPYAGLEPQLLRAQHLSGDLPFALAKAAVALVGVVARNWPESIVRQIQAVCAFECAATVLQHLAAFEDTHLATQQGTQLATLHSELTRVLHQAHSLIEALRAAAQSCAPKSA